MNIYCPHCGKKNSSESKSCVGCNGNLNSLGAVSAASSNTFTPVMVRAPEKSLVATTRSEWEARRAARKSISDSPAPGAPALAGANQDDDNDEGVQVFNADSFLGKLTFSSSDADEDGKKEAFQFTLNTPKAPSAKAPSSAPKRGRPPGSKNKK